ncbi:O-antigen ligase domain-containing protein [Cognatishimia sp. 1_MG-2023]|uniref:O-antigen ligase domain-containing protein n=1 Tax=Cognatishimia sp. 1_MG-2023 TaxID=3062642 RepID=UPI0026E1870B|nr:O-antigen ligase domain-containing protein [Cognatishimia sp. 1_MG-2023]MDO6725768.1 O-antigen ligase domain-containing protein [Cognatishimia sp. 1_MG-2023]
MDKLSPENPAEWLAYKTLTYTWPLYAIGALYIAGPVIAWSLGTLAVVALYLGPAMRVDLKPHPIPPVVWAWILGMGAMLPILWLGHINWNFSAAQTIKSTIGWAKGWALMALFPLAGAVLPIRRSILIRGQCIVGLWVLCLAPLMLAAPYIGLPERIFTSPLKVVGGPGPEYFTVFLFTYDPATWSPRWQFFAPWSPFAALLGVMMVLFALEEENRNWRAIGIAAGTLMVLASKSRMGLVGLVLCTMPPRALGLMSKRWAWFTAAGLTASLAMTADRLIQTLTTGIATFKNARADSTRVRATLQRIAEERWWEEAIWFGHGRPAPGGHIVEYMPIGTHHTWYGLLFVKGVTGFLALMIPLVFQTLLALADTIASTRGRLPLGILMVILLLSFGENIEIEAYLLWPGLMVLGIHAREIAETSFVQAPTGGVPA